MDSNTAISFYDLDLDFTVFYISPNVWRHDKTESTPHSPPRATPSFVEFLCSFTYVLELESNLNSSNTDGSFIMANSKSLFDSLRNSSIAQESKYLGKFSYFIRILNVVCTH